MVLVGTYTCFKKDPVKYEGQTREPRTLAARHRTLRCFRWSSSSLPAPLVVNLFNRSEQTSMASSEWRGLTTAAFINIFSTSLKSKPSLGVQDLVICWSLSTSWFGRVVRASGLYEVSIWYNMNGGISFMNWWNSEDYLAHGNSRLKVDSWPPPADIFP